MAFVYVLFSHRMDPLGMFCSTKAFDQTWANGRSRVRDLSERLCRQALMQSNLGQFSAKNF